MTHQLHHLRSADKIITLKNGSIEHIDTFENLLVKSDIFSKAIQKLTSESIDNPKSEYVNFKSLSFYMNLNKLYLTYINIIT